MGLAAYNLYKGSLIVIPLNSTRLEKFIKDSFRLDCLFLNDLISIKALSSAFSVLSALLDDGS